MEALKNDIIKILINNREKFVDKLFQDYSYETLLNLFAQIDSETDDKYLYKLLTGTCSKGIYDKSSIDWIPSVEVVSGIIKLCDYFKIEYIDELYSGMGILSALIIKEANKDGKNIYITTADTFETLATCNKLGFVPIAKRNASDYIFYTQLLEPYPQMVICTKYYSFSESQQKKLNYLDEISDLVGSQNHNIIIIFTSFTSTCSDLFYHMAVNYNYFYKSYYIKAVDKYYFILQLMKKYYESFMVMHVFIKRDLFISNTNQNIVIDSIFEKAILPCSFINIGYTWAKWLELLYDMSSSKLVKSFYRDYDVAKSTQFNNLNELTSSIAVLKYYNFVRIPEYIFDSKEFFFWVKRIIVGSFYIFTNRNQFYTFYTQAINIDDPEIKKKIPQWIKSINLKYDYIYLDTIEYSESPSWRTEQNIFNQVIKNIHIANKKVLIS